MERLSIASDGQTLYFFKRTALGAASVFKLSPTEFIAKLASLVPPPYPKASRMSDQTDGKINAPGGVGAGDVAEAPIKAPMSQEGDKIGLGDMLNRGRFPQPGRDPKQGK